MPVTIPVKKLTMPFQIFTKKSLIPCQISCHEVPNHPRNTFTTLPRVVRIFDSVLTMKSHVEVNIPLMPESA